MEILISVGILAILATLLAQVLYTTTHVNKKTEIITTIKQEGNFALDVIARTLRTARVIDITCAVGQTTAAVARITGPDNTVTTFACFADGSTARIASESASQTVYLSSGNLTLSSSGGADCTDSSLTFSCPPADGSIQTQVTVSFTLGQIGVAGAAYESGSEPFEATVRMRK